MKNLHLRLDDELHALLVQAAANDSRSLNGEVAVLLRNALQAEAAEVKVNRGES